MHCHIRGSLFFFLCFFCKLFDLFAGTCKRRVKFTSELEGRALHGHVIKNLTLPQDVRNPCRSQCVMDSRCVSINIGLPINNKVICELSDSDLSLHPADLKARQGFTFIGTEVRNKNSVLNYNSSCLIIRKVCELFIFFLVCFGNIGK